MTGVSQFQQSTGTKTLILGWWTEGSVFAGFDVRKHSAPLGFSPSLQIRKHSLELAAESGFAPSDKGNQEIAIAFRPDFFASTRATWKPCTTSASPHRTLPPSKPLRRNRRSTRQSSAHES